MEEATTNHAKKFQLRNAKEILEFLRNEICSKDENDVDLVLISFILGMVENQLTIGSGGDKCGGKEFPVIDSSVVLSLVDDFRDYIRSNVTNVQNGPGVEFTDRQTIKDVASAVWKRLSKSFQKDKPHCQTLYTFKNGGYLDCFGLAYAVVAGCQVLGCDDVHLCLSEDHAWITFGPDSSLTAEITWHGKQKEIHRGQPIDNGLVPASCWLYLGGKPVFCRSRRMEATAAVAMINAAIDNKNSCDSLNLMKKDLMWTLYDTGCMSRYPMALCVLADVQEHYPTTGRPDVDDIYHFAIDCARSFYDDNHVYPYSEYGCFLHRKKNYEQALFRWQQAAGVLAKYYNYNREEEELYKEIIDIANNFIPTAMRSISDAGSSSFFQNTDNLTNLLLFYDGICEWEQNGTTPVFHSGWAKAFTQSLNYFPVGTRVSILGSPAAAVQSMPVIVSPLPHSPVKNVEAYRRSLVSTVLNVYGNGRGGEASKEERANADEFVQLCETTKLKADLVWNPEVVGPDRSDTPVASRLELRSRKMKSLGNILVRNHVRVSDVDLQLCAHIEMTASSSERKKLKK